MKNIKCLTVSEDENLLAYADTAGTVFMKYTQDF